MPGADDRRGAAAGCTPRRQYLGQHPARTHGAARATGHLLQRRVAGLHLEQQHRVRITSRVGREQAVLVRENDQPVGFDEVGHERAQRVVVPHLDLVGRHRVVLVDDRYHAQRQQRLQHGACVQVTPAVSQVFMGQQHLRGLDAVALEGVLVGLGNAHLTNGGRSLQLTHFPRPLLPAQPFHAFGNGTRGHQHDLGQDPRTVVGFVRRVMAGTPGRRTFSVRLMTGGVLALRIGMGGSGRPRPQCRHLVGPVVQRLLIHALPAACHQRRTYLDHQSLRGHGVLHGSKLPCNPIIRPRKAACPPGPGTSAGQKNPPGPAWHPDQDAGPSSAWRSAASPAAASPFTTSAAFSRSKRTSGSTSSGGRSDSR